MEKPLFSFDLAGLDRAEATDIQRESMRQFVVAWATEPGPKRPLTTYAPTLDRTRMGYFWRSALDVA